MFINILLSRWAGIKKVSHINSVALLDDGGRCGCHQDQGSQQECLEELHLERRYPGKILMINCRVLIETCELVLSGCVSLTEVINGSEEE